MLYLVRHGRTDANAAGRLLGHLDLALDDLGRAQAEAVARVLPRPVRVVASPLERALATAAAISDEIEVDERWIELDYGDFDGMPLGDLDGSVWRSWRADLDFRPPGGESLRELGYRVAGACEELRERARDEDVAVVSHVSPIKAAITWALDVGDEAAWHTFVSPGSISTVRLGPHGPVVCSFNETAHLPDTATT